MAYKYRDLFQFVQRERLRKALIDLLEQDKEFRYTVAGLIGYKEILERLANVEERLADLNERLLKVEERLANVEERLLKVEERLANHEERLLKVEERLANVEERLLKVEERLLKVEEEIKNLRIDMQEGFKRFE